MWKYTIISEGAVSYSILEQSVSLGDPTEYCERQMKRLHGTNWTAEEITLKEARQEAGLSQADVQNLFDVPARSLQNWENGVNKVPPYIERYLLQNYFFHIRKKEVDEWIDDIGRKGIGSGTVSTKYFSGACDALSKLLLICY